jgi:copper resistance protein C
MRTILFVLCLLLVALATTTAQPHAFLDHARPLVGSTVASAPHEVTLSFTQKLEPAFSSVTVTDASGNRVDQSKPQISGSTMSVGLKSIGPGTVTCTGTRCPSTPTKPRAISPSTSAAGDLGQSYSSGVQQGAV